MYIQKDDSNHFVQLCLVFLKSAAKPEESPRVCAGIVPSHGIQAYSCGESAFSSSVPASGPQSRIKVQSEGCFLLLHPSSVTNDLWCLQLTLGSTSLEAHSCVYLALLIKESL